MNLVKEHISNKSAEDRGRERVRGRERESMREKERAGEIVGTRGKTKQTFT